MISLYSNRLKPPFFPKIKRTFVTTPFLDGTSKHTVNTVHLTLRTLKIYPYWGFKANLYLNKNYHTRQLSIFGTLNRRIYTEIKLINSRLGLRLVTYDEESQSQNAFIYFPLTPQQFSSCCHIQREIHFSEQVPTKFHISFHSQVRQVYTENQTCLKFVYKVRPGSTRRGLNCLE